jgi:hypothetical protein
MSAKRIVIASLVLLAFVATVQAGGWSVTTLRELPEYAVAGKPLPLTFMVRGHGMTPLDGLLPPVEATSGLDIVMMLAAPTKETPGEYRAALVLPHAGTWLVEIDGKVALRALTVIAPGTAPPPRLSPASLGERLFVAKGCLDCHANREVTAGKTGGVGPELTGRRFPDAYLRSLLADPKKTFARDPESGLFEMPNLELKESDIASLVAFINRDRRR